MVNTWFDNRYYPRFVYAMLRTLPLRTLLARENVFLHVWENTFFYVVTYGKLVLFLISYKNLLWEAFVRNLIIPRMLDPSDS